MNELFSFKFMALNINYGAKLLLRYLCAAKMVYDSAKINPDLPEDVLYSVTDIECLEYIGTDAKASWIFQGLRHISGITDWSPFNKAKLLVEQIENDNLTLTRVGERF
ncbi:MAG: hypothetical protein GY749_22270, partial [Desulfobacteraceae bacterium]|nr:hypothetical protein [Desulfobacteraceae bacterium]